MFSIRKTHSGANMNVLLALTLSLLVGTSVVGYKLPTSKTWKERCKRKGDEANETKISGFQEWTRRGKNLAGRMNVDLAIIRPRRWT